MSDKYKFFDPDGLYFITSTVVEWVDVFTKSIYMDTILDSLKFCQKNKGLNIHSSAIDYSGGKGLLEVEIIV